jgi:hypothetical protein
VAVRAGIFAVVDIAPVQQCLIFAVRGNEAARRFYGLHGPAHVVFLLNARPSSENPATFWRAPGSPPSPPPFCPTVMQP